MRIRDVLAYLPILIIIVLLWIGSFYTINNAINQVARELLEEKASVLSLTQANQVLSDCTQVKDTLSKYQTKHTPLITAVEILSQKDSNRNYYLMDQKGKFYTKQKWPVETLDPSMAKMAVSQGFSYGYIPSEQGEEGDIAIVFLYGDKDSSLIVMTESVDTFMAQMRSKLDIPVESSILFDPTGAPRYVPEEKNSQTDSLLDGQRSFTNENGSYSIEPAYGDFNLYLPIYNSGGWVFASCISKSQLIPGILEILPLLAFFILSVVSIFTLMAITVREKNNHIASQKNSTRDLLTGLLNSSSLSPAMNLFFKKDEPKDFSLIALDISGFRRFNIMFGQKAGDTLLRSVGKCLLDHFYCSSRINGDIFIFLTKSRPDLIEDIEDKLYRTLKKDLSSRYLPFVSFKFGAYPLLEAEFIFRDAYDGALLALKTVKQSPEHNAVFYDRAMRQQEKIRKDIEVNMHYALATHEFLLYIQPKFDTQSSECCGGEALVRWQSEQMGFLAPRQFIPLFEQNGFISELDFYMLTSILNHLQEMIDQGEKLLPISVNQSRVTISYPDYLDKLRKLISHYTVPLDLIEIEITESTMTEDFDFTISLAHTYRKMGFTVAMDDFGTGYSSLNTLRELPVDVLKIDKDFLQESDNSVKGRRIIQGILDMSKDLEITTVCEGVETQMQLDFLKKSGCDLVQGYLLSRPIPYEEYKKRYLD